MPSILELWAKISLLNFKLSQQLHLWLTHLHPLQKEIRPQTDMEASMKGKAIYMQQNGRSQKTNDQDSTSFCLWLPTC